MRPYLSLRILLVSYWIMSMDLDLYEKRNYNSTGCCSTKCCLTSHRSIDRPPTQSMTCDAMRSRKREEWQQRCMVCCLLSSFFSRRIDLSKHHQHHRWHEMLMRSRILLEVCEGKRGTTTALGAVNRFIRPSTPKFIIIVDRQQTARQHCANSDSELQSLLSLAWGSHTSLQSPPVHLPNN